MKEITRRQFIQGLAAGAAGIGLSRVFHGLVPEAEAASDTAPEKAPASASDFTLTVLGARGSSPVCRGDSMAFGGSTSCYMLRAGGETIFLDAGSGLLSAPAEYPKPPVFLLSHLHVDHILGLGMYSWLSKKEAETTIYVPVEDGNALQALDGLYSPPYWPLSLTAYGSTVQVLPHSFPLQIGEITVDGMKGCHPGGVWCFRIRYHGKTLVYASDFEHEEPYFSELIEFSRGADLILYDAQYTAEEYETKKGFGHSTAEKGLELLERAEAGQLLLIHHDPFLTDRQLLDREAQIGRDNVRFAREGEVISLSCTENDAVKETIAGNVKTYSRLNDGTWQCDDYIYQYRLEISGRMPNAAKDSTFVYLSNIEEISFEQAYRAAGISSDLNDYFAPEEAVLVEMN